MYKLAISKMAVLSLVVVGCSSNGGGGSKSNVNKPPPGQPGQIIGAPANANPPYQIAAADDLALFMVHVHQDLYGDPTHFGFWWSVQSTFATGLNSVRWRLTRLDASQETTSGTIDIPAMHAGGDGHDHNIEWTESAPGRHFYALTIDSDNDLDEAGRANNTYVFIVDVPAAPDQSDPNDLEFYAREAHVHFMMPDFGYIVHFQARNTAIADAPATRWRLQIPTANIDQVFDLGPIPAGGIAEDSFAFQLVEPGTHTATVTIDADNEVAENNESNNTRPFTILVGEPRGNG